MRQDTRGQNLTRSCWVVAAAFVATYLIALQAAVAATAPRESSAPPGVGVPAGPFQPTWESLKQYRCPEWFRDAKLGFWAHWGPQAVPMAGDWYARNMYLQDSAQYNHHLENYGHPSRQGYKDIIPLWKAEKWDPDRQMALYKRAGARYFVSMGVHHDNFDLWNSHYHRWNAVNFGPHRDVVGTWKKAAQRQGLRFGVSEHLGASFTWFQVSHGADKTGPQAGVPYDGGDPRYEDLYHFPAEPSDTAWYSTNPRWHREWFRRIQDLVDHYQLDLLYTDGGVPFGNEVGRSLIAHLYNTDLKRHGGRLQAVYTCKQKPEGMWVEDLERGVMAGIRPEPWQTDTSIGDWYYNKNWKFRKVDWVIHMLVDIVSKNGNLLLNVVQRPDGSLDPEVEQLLQEMATWIHVNGEAIYGTRPWVTYGEGPTQTKGGHFKEDFGYSAADIRFTTKNGVLYATILGWPADRQVRIKSLARSAGSGTVTKVSLLGSRQKPVWTHDADGLNVTLPERRLSDVAIVLKISGRRLGEFKPVETGPVVVLPDAQGRITLSPEQADLHGSGIATEAQGGEPNVGFWDNPDEYVSWKVRVAEPVGYAVSTACAAATGPSRLALTVGDQRVEALVPQTTGWDDFQPVNLGRLEIKQAGEVEIQARPAEARAWKPLNLRQIRMVPVR